MMKVKLRIAIFSIIVKWLSRHYLCLTVHHELIQQWVRLVQKRAETRGTVETIGWIKAIRLSFTRFLSRTPLSESPGFGVQLDTFGLPIGNPLVPLFTSRDSTLLRLGFTLLSVSRILPGWKAPDLAPITTTGASFQPALAEEVSAVVTELGWKLPFPEWEGCHVSTKSGPNAQALLGSIEDASLLTPRQLELLAVVGGEALVRLIGNIRLISPLAWLAKFKLAPKGRQSRLTLVKDKEAKVRIVAILDYWTQTALKPLHDLEMRFLKSLKPDCTFNQGSFRAKLGSIGPFHSIDLTTATDRMPVWIQETILAVMLSKEWAAAWRELLVDRDYDVTWVRNERRQVRYACGQPMGAYSSWATFSITHHAIVRVAAKRAGLPVTFSDYALLGDDIVIRNDAVAAEYRTLLSSLGVEVSVAKTHVSIDTYEFAKRWIHVGTEVSPAPLGSLFEAMRFTVPTPKEELGVPTKRIRRLSFYEVATWLREVEARWMPRSETLVSRGLVADLFSTLGSPGNPRLVEKCWRFFLLPVREDSRSLRRYKSRILGSYLVGDILTCGSIGYAATLVAVYLNECKARVLEEAIKSQIGMFQQFQLELPSYLSLIPEGLDAQSLLLSLPPFDVLRRNVAGLQLEFDKAHRVRESDDLMHWLHLDVRLFLSPYEAMSTRRSKTVAMSKATILNHVSAMCRGIARMRNLAISSPGSSDASLEELVRIINSYDVRPTRGTSRKRRKG